MTTVVTSAQPQQLRVPGNPELRLPLKRPVYFKDLNMDWGGLGDYANGLVIYNDDAIRVKIYNVLGTLPGSEPFEPLFGSSLPTRLFEPINADTAFEIEFDVVTALTEQMADEITILHNQTFIEEVSSDGGLGFGYQVTVTYVNNYTRVIGSHTVPMLRG